MERVRARDAVLVVWQDADSAWLERFAEQVRGRCEGSPQLERADRLHAAGLNASSWDAALVVGRYEEGEGGPPAELLAEVLRLLKPRGVLVLPPPRTPDTHLSLLSRLRLSGYVSASLIDDYIVAEKPNFEVGARSSLRARHLERESEAAVRAAWGGAAESGGAEPGVTWGGEAGEELVDDEQLLDDADLKRPDVASLRVCGTTGVRKACADCSCGLAEELRADTGNNTSSTAVKSSCGSCYLGDAFRCSTCPYLGTPAFQPGERVLLADLASDI